MTVVIDTNAVLPVLGLRHRFSVILDTWTIGRFDWALSTEILLKYEEIVAPRIGPARWHDFISLLDIVAVRHGNLRRISPQFRFRVISADPDDDKFVDCAIVADAEWIITEDGQFDVLVSAGYRLQPMLPREFIRRFLP